MKFRFIFFIALATFSINLGSHVAPSPIDCGKMVARPLRPTSFDLLAYLAANPGRIISTDELTGAVWPGRSVSPETLAQAMGEVRQALHTEASVIRAIPGEGYRFEAEVRRADPGTDPYGHFVEDEGATIHLKVSGGPAARTKTRWAWGLAAAPTWSHALAA